MEKPTYSAPGAIQRMPGESFASFSARQRESQLAAKQSAPKRRRAVSARKTAEQRAADRVDGFDRDDLGESADY